MEKDKQIDAIQKIMGKEKSGRQMVFGKYAGHDLSDIPTGYLKWAANNFDDVFLVNDIEKELERRK